MDNKALTRLCSGWSWGEERRWGVFLLPLRWTFGVDFDVFRNQFVFRLSCGPLFFAILNRAAYDAVGHVLLKPRHAPSAVRKD